MRDLPRFIGIGGRIGAGKDVVADYLATTYGYIKLAFAQALKDELIQRMPQTLRRIAAFNGIPATVSLEEVVFMRKPFGIREILQEYGSEVRRGDDPDYWVKAWNQRVKALLAHDARRRFVAPDVRFPNEVHSIRQRGGVVWRVARFNQHAPLHASEELAMQNQHWDLTLHNDGPFDQLYRSVEAALIARVQPTGQHTMQG